MTLNEFLENPYLRNAWLREPFMDVYVRRGAHCLGDKHSDTFDIANVSVDDLKRGTGVFTAFLERVEELGLPVFVENVLDDRFQMFFLKRGYLVHPHSDESIKVLSFIRPGV